MRVTLRPRDSRIAASDADAMPLPSEDTTPPVTKTNLVMACGTARRDCRSGKGRFYRRGFARPSGCARSRGAAMARPAPRLHQHVVADQPDGHALEREVDVAEG